MTAPFAIERHDAWYCRVSNGEVAFIRYRPTWKWEGYAIVQTGRHRGLEEFVRYLSDDEAARLDAAIATEEARERLLQRGITKEMFLGVRSAYECVATGRLVY